jgi:predicted DNA-binding protein (MmcQ/YjbR family)
MVLPISMTSIYPHMAMTRDGVLERCADLPESVEDYPFGDDVAVFKIGGKMFALVALSGDPGLVTLKCDPEFAVELRERHRAVRPGYHLNKRHWNTVDLDGTVPDEVMTEMITASYDLVVHGLSRAERHRLLGN